MPPPTPADQEVVLVKATREKLKLRAIIAGATGSGKTCTGFRLCNALVARYGGKIGVIDTQNRQSLDYAETEFAPHGFYPYHLTTGRPEAYTNALGIFARDPDFTVVFIDSLSDAWQGHGGVLEQAGDDAQFKDWGPAKRGNFKLLETIQKAPFHVVTTVLADTQYLISTESRDGKTKMSGVSVIGTKPIQDKKTMPKFPLQVSMDEYHRMTVIRTSFPPFDRVIVEKPGEDFWTPYLEWLDKGKVPENIEGLDVRAASTAQLAEYWDLQTARGLKREVVLEAFYKKYGTKPEDCTEEFFEERLKELRASVRTTRRMPVSQSTKGGVNVSGNETSPGQSPAGNTPAGAEGK